MHRTDDTSFFPSHQFHNLQKNKIQENGTAPFFHVQHPKLSIFCRHFTILNHSINVEASPMGRQFFMGSNYPPLNFPPPLLLFHWFQAFQKFYYFPVNCFTDIYCQQLEFFIHVENATSLKLTRIKNFFFLFFWILQFSHPIIRRWTVYAMPFLSFFFFFYCDCHSVFLLNLWTFFYILFWFFLITSTQQSRKQSSILDSLDPERLKKKLYLRNSRDKQPKFCHDERWSGESNDFDVVWHAALFAGWSFCRPSQGPRDSVVDTQWPWV